MMTSEEATAANQELHSRLTLVEGTVNGPTASGASGVVVRRITLAEQLVNTTGACAGRATRRPDSACAKVCSAVPTFGGGQKLH